MMKSGHHLPSSIRVAAAQVRFAQSIEANLEQVADFATRAKKRRVDALLFPECMTTGYNTDFSSLQASRIRSALQAISDIAAEKQLNLLIGTPLFHRRKLYNALVVFDREGRPVHAYAKCQLTPADKDHFTPGNAVSIFTIDGIPATSIICHERRYPELVRIPAMAGARIIFHPNAGLDSRSISRSKHNGKDGIAIRSFENAVAYVFANSVGPQGNSLWSAGDSKIVAADGKTLCLADNENEDLIVATLDLEESTRKYALDSLQHPRFLAPHWKQILRAAREQSTKESEKLLNDLL